MFSKLYQGISGNIRGYQEISGDIRGYRPRAEVGTSFSLVIPKTKLAAAVKSKVQIPQFDQKLEDWKKI